MDDRTVNRPRGDQDDPQYPPAPEQPPAYRPPANGRQTPYPYEAQPPHATNGIPVPSQQYSEAGSPQTAPEVSRRYVVPAILGALGIFLVLTGFLLGGEFEKFMTVGAMIAPLAILAALAYGGVNNSVAAIFTYVWLGMLSAAILGYSLVLVMLAFLRDPKTTSLSEMFRPGLGPPLLWAMLLLMLTALASATMLLRPVRAAMSRIMSIDPDNFVHKIALVIITLITLSSFVPIVVLAGLPPMLELVNSGALGSLGGDSGLSVRGADLVYQFAWTVPAALVAAGWPIARRFRATLARLGMVRPSLPQVSAGVFLGLGMAFLSSFLLDPALSRLWTEMGWPATDMGAVSRLLRDLTTPAGAVLIGVTAGIGEEMAVRGLLQPRVGLIASNLLFTSLHASQYGFDGLLSVFLVGCVLGVVRNFSNTSTSAIVHGVYNFTLVMMSVVADA